MNKEQEKKNEKKIGNDDQKEKKNKEHYKNNENKNGDDDQGEKKKKEHEIFNRNENGDDEHEEQKNKDQDTNNEKKEGDDDQKEKKNKEQNKKDRNNNGNNDQGGNKNKDQDMYGNLPNFVGYILLVSLLVLGMAWLGHFYIENKNETMKKDFDIKIQNIQLESEKKMQILVKEKEDHYQQKMQEEKSKREEKFEKLKEKEQAIELERLNVAKEALKEEFSHWIAQEITNADADYNIQNMKNIKEFHRCKAIENVDKESFHDIVENIARVLHLSDERKEEIELSSKADNMVNVLEDFEHGESGKYSYGKYQTFRRANGNMDIFIALHSLTFELEPEYHQHLEKKDEKETDIAILSPNKALTSRERTAVKSAFRGQAIRLFESDCPNKLLTDMDIATQAEIRKQAKIEKGEEEMKKKEEEMKKKEELATTIYENNITIQTLKNEFDEVQSEYEKYLVDMENNHLAEKEEKEYKFKKEIEEIEQNRKKQTEELQEQREKSIEKGYAVILCLVFLGLGAMLAILCMKNK